MILPNSNLILEVLVPNRHAKVEESV
jgi:hypothetical protein